jgi:hypothetical protein
MSLGEYNDQNEEFGMRNSEFPTPRWNFGFRISDFRPPTRKTKKPRVHEAYLDLYPGKAEETPAPSQENTLRLCAFALKKKEFE